MSEEKKLDSQESPKPTSGAESADSKIPAAAVAAENGGAPKKAEETRADKDKGKRNKPKRPFRRRQKRAQDGDFVEKVVSVNRVSKVVQGGKNFSFAALVVVGDGKGKIGFSVGKAREVQDAIQKGLAHAKNRMKMIPLAGSTIPHETVHRFSAAKVFMKPASEGTGVIAGAAVRAVCECAGIKDILTKSLGSQTPLNVVQATIEGLLSMLPREAKVVV